MKWQIQLRFCGQIISVCKCERNIKIGQYLPKLCSNEKWSSFFSDSQCTPRWMDFENALSNQTPHFAFTPTLLTISPQVSFTECILCNYTQPQAVRYQTYTFIIFGRRPTSLMTERRNTNENITVQRSWTFKTNTCSMLA